ncbi:MAG: hypothetical protein [Inoviridae sp.]|nr:MAG: hypothetical protein [Inoviridae sp.]
MGPGQAGAWLAAIWCRPMATGSTRSACVAYCSARRPRRALPGRRSAPCSPSCCQPESGSGVPLKSGHQEDAEGVPCGRATRRA